MAKEVQGIYLPMYAAPTAYYKMQVGDVKIEMEYQYDRECWLVTAIREGVPDG